MNPLLLDLSMFTRPPFLVGFVGGLSFWVGAKWGALREARRIFRSKRYASRREAMLRGWRPPSFLDRLLLGRRADSILASGGKASGETVRNPDASDPFVLPLHLYLYPDRGSWRAVSAAPAGASVIDCSRPRNDPGAS